MCKGVEGKIIHILKYEFLFLSSMREKMVLKTFKEKESQLIVFNFFFFFFTMRSVIIRTN